MLPHGRFTCWQDSGYNNRRTAGPAAQRHCYVTRMGIRSRLAHLVSTVKERTVLPLDSVARGARWMLLAGRALPQLDFLVSPRTAPALPNPCKAYPLLPLVRCSAPSWCVSLVPFAWSEAEGLSSRSGMGELGSGFCGAASDRRAGTTPRAGLIPPHMPNGLWWLPRSTTSFPVTTSKNACLFPHSHGLGRLRRGGTQPPDYGCIFGQVCPAALSGVNR